MLSPHEVTVLVASTALGLLDSAVKSRAKGLGGWDKVVVQQGLFKKTDPAIKIFQDAETQIFDAMYNAQKKLDRAIPKSAVGVVGLKPHYEIYSYAGQVSNEVDRCVNAFAEGQEDNVTYTDGYLNALKDIETLMITRKMSRQKALDTLRTLTKKAEPLR